MPRPYAALRGLMAQHDTNCSIIGKIIGVTEKSAISHRMTNKTPWKLNEIYAIMDEFKIPYSDLHIYFPKDGQGAGV